MKQFLILRFGSKTEELNGANENHHVKLVTSDLVHQALQHWVVDSQVWLQIFRLSHKTACQRRLTPGLTNILTSYRPITSCHPLAAVTQHLMPNPRHIPTRQY